ncbi:hypothetical protein DM806_11040 [Sphingobium lactosutens]|uniref:FecR family protein n=1 Tax=Sphingobium lactosutens TaxID=522773 RepID=UPI0015B7B8BD|nr:FecR domain-containing protein [Sphingobium lactosutens]NWK96195.1 hypothetical protein [Sphingobium lactosutens]
MSRAGTARDQAAQWLIAREQKDWDAEQQASFDAWLAESDMNKAAFWRLEHSWSEADRIRALGSADSPPTDWADVSETKIFTPWHKWKRTSLITGIAASFVFLLGASAFYLIGGSDGERQKVVAHYATKVGGHSRAQLSDGSQIELNTATSVRTAIDVSEREVWLDKGEAFFEVAHQHGRPFIVHAGTRTIVVLGTKFAVRRDGARVTVSVLEGRVRVDDFASQRADRSTIITTGESAIGEGASTLVTSGTQGRIVDALSWREGMLHFDDKALGDIAAEFNRYNQVKIIVADAEVSAVRIGGTFPASEPAGFARLLRQAYGLNIQETDEAIKIFK